MRGEGSISFKAEKGLYCGQVSLGYDGQGRRIRRTIYGKTRREVRDKLLQLQQDVRNGLPTKPDRLTVAQHFEDWLRAKKPDVASATYLKYHRLTKDHIAPGIGHLKLKDLDYRRINTLYEFLDEKGLARTSVASIAAVLSMGLGDAVKKGLIPHNPVKLSAKRSPGKGEARFMTQEEIDVFLLAAKGERLEDAFLLALHTGLRPGELLGLPWDAVDLDSGKLSVRQALHEEDGNLFIGDTKTPAAKRIISLSQAATSALRRQRRRQLEEQLAHKGTWGNEDGLVFTDTAGSLLRRTNIARRDLKRVLRRAAVVRLARRCGLLVNELLSIYRESGDGPVRSGQKLRLGERVYTVEPGDLLEGVTLHTFRHTHASILIFQREDIKTVSARLGHRSVKFTYDTYGHLLPGSDERAADAMDAFMSSLPR